MPSSGSPPRRCQIVQNNRPQRQAAFRRRDACFLRLQHRVHDLAEDVELQLPGGAVSDPDRRRLLVSGQPVDDLLRQPSLAAHAIHDLDLVRAAGDGADQPIPPGLRLLVISEMHQGHQREGGVPQPAIAVIPVPHATEALGKRCRGRGDDAAGRRVGQSLQRDQRPFDRLGPGTDLRTAIAPLPPECFGARQRIEAVDRWRRVFERGRAVATAQREWIARPRRRTRRPSCRSSPLKRDRSAQHDTLPAGNRVDRPVIEPRDPWDRSLRSRSAAQARSERPSAPTAP